MKNKLIIISTVCCACICLAENANAQNPKKFPPLKTGMTSDTSSPTPSPAKKGAETKAANGTLSAKDKEFMKKAAKGGMMEVEWGKVAGQNSQNADVKKFGNRMVTDHGKANSELMALAQQKGVQLPGSKAAGKWKSDKDYMDMMVKDHTNDLAEFRAEAQNGTDADLKKFAEKGSKMIEKHLNMAKEIQGKLK